VLGEWPAVSGAFSDGELESSRTDDDANEEHHLPRRQRLPAGEDGAPTVKAAPSPVHTA
jgi:hypothetical protein